MIPAGALNLTTSAMGTAVGLSTDLNTGVIDRFRTAPLLGCGATACGAAAE